MHSSTKILYAFLITPMCVSSSTYLILPDLVTLYTVMKGTSYEAPHCASVSSFLLLLVS
jgi:hypothetical protein